LNAMGKKSSARPAPAATPKAVITTQLAKRPRAGGPRVVVLDTGLAAEGKFFPQALRPAPVAAESDMDFDVPDLDVPADGLLDQVAGHGTFIAGLICQVAPGTDVTVHRVLATVGDTDEWRVVHRLLQLKNTLAEPERTILSLSFGGYVLDFPILLAAAITDLQGAKVVVVASAGNDATCEPMYPAALPGVVSVGAIGPDGPARFTNYGSWVRACAPGVDLLSTFFQFQGVTPAQGQLDPDDFDGWAVWSGTSFSAPIVAGALARTMALENCTAEDAVERIVDNPSLLRIPGLGTVVNVL
jgi:subtilisin family serine protease